MRHRLRRLVDNRWFPLVDLLFVMGSGATWYFRPGLGWKILGFALLPWLIRLLAGRFPFKRTPFDLPILVFMITALVGARLAYDLSLSWAKFWIIFAAILFFYALAGQPRENTWVIVGAVSTLGAVISVYYLLVYDWEAIPVRVELVNKIGRAWMTVRPSVPLPAIKDEDIISNLLLVLSPFPVLLFTHGLSRCTDNSWLLLVGLGYLIIFGLGLVMAATLQAVLFGCAGVMIAVWWGISTWLDGKQTRWSRKAFYLISGLAILFIFFLIILIPDQVVNLVEEMPFLERFENRLAVIDNTLNLTKDYLFTGGGLESFPGLYSRYILAVPYLLISFGSNLFLQLVMEHGVFGSFAYLSIIIGGLSILMNKLYRNELEKNKNQLAYLCIVGYAAVFIVGMFDAILYRGLNIFILFITPGFAVFALSQPERKEFNNYYPIIIFGASFIVFILGIGWKIPAAFYANLGAQKMAQIDLKGWTGEEAIETKPIEKYAGAVVFFTKSLEADPLNATANYRMGLLEENQGNYLSGINYLEKAHLSEPDHRGIMKNLGYCYLWMGNIDLAENYLKVIPESIDELNIYSWWWGTQDRDDLSGYASQMVNRLYSMQTKGNP